MAKQTTDTEYARAWLAQRRDALRADMEAQRTALSVQQGRIEEIDRLIGELDQNIMPTEAVPPVGIGPPPRSETKPPAKRRVYKIRPYGIKYPELRQTILMTLRGARTQGMRLADLREALTAKGVSYPSNFLSIVLHEEKLRGRVAHNPHTGRHRWVGDIPDAPAEPQNPSPDDAVTRRGHPGRIGDNRQTMRAVLKEAGDAGMMKASIRLACEARGASMSGSLLGVTLIADRRLGYVSYHEPTGVYHWTGPQGTASQTQEGAVSCRIPIPTLYQADHAKTLTR